MYSNDSTFISERSRIKPTLRGDPQFLHHPPINTYSNPSTTRNHLNDHSIYSPNSIHDKTMISPIQSRHEYPQEPIRPFREQPSIGNFPPQLSNMSFLNVPRPNKGYHARTGSNPLMSNYSNIFSNPPVLNPHPMVGFSNPNPLLMNFPGQFPTSPLDLVSEIREEKMMKFFERQNAVIEKLAFRIQKEERDSIQREKKELEQKLRDLQTEKVLRQQHEESLKLMQKVQSENTIPKLSVHKSSPSKEKSSSNLLETLGKMYLAQKIANNSHKRSKSYANGLSLGRNLINTKLEEALLPNRQENEGEENDEDFIPKPRPKKESSFKIRKFAAPKLVFEDMEDHDSPTQKGVPSLYSSKVLSAREFGERPSLADLESQSPGNNSKKNKDLKKEKSQRRIRKEQSKKMLKELERLEGEEELKKQEADLNKLKEKKRKQALTKLKPLLWGVVYGNILFMHVKKQVEARKEDIQKKMSENIQMNFEVAQNFILSVGDKYLRELVKESKNLEMYNSKKSFSSGELDTRMNFIFDKLKGVFDKLIVGTNPTNLPKNFLRFLASISEDSGVLPSNFMFDFELKRLQFTHYATLKAMTPQKSKMVIGLFILLRILVHRIIMRPWTVLPGIKKENVKINNLVTIGSILYHIVLDFYRGSVPIIQNNQSFLPVELKIKPRNVPLTATDDVPDLNEQEAIKPKEEKGKEPEPITGFFTKNELKSCFVDRKKLYDQLKALVDGWLEKIYDLVHSVYLQTPKEQRELLGIPL